MRAHRAFLLLCFLALSACGGGGDSASPSSTVAPAPPAAASPPAPPPTAAADVTCGLANFEADALRLINARRAAGATCGSRGSFAPAGPLSAQPLLIAAAFGHSRDMADKNYFSHTGLDGRSMSDRINATGYRWTLLGENIAAGYGTVQQTIDAWMASDGHCANLMEPRFTEFGLACARSSASTYGSYWTLDLGRP